jgi:SAM-dependent methyltransferase
MRVWWLSKKMERDWDRRARENARFYVATSRTDWTDEEFFRSGRAEIEEQILCDLDNVCQGRDPKQMRVLEIGCGAGRVTRALAEVFGEVHAVDVSSEMLRQAAGALRDKPNVFLHKNNGRDLAVLKGLEFDFAFSLLVFQHIPDRAIIENYIREVGRLLRPGCLFKAQLQGDGRVRGGASDTWLGASYSEQDAIEMAARCGLEARHRAGAGEQYFWVWLFKPADISRAD